MRTIFRLVAGLLSVLMACAVVPTSVVAEPVLQSNSAEPAPISTDFVLDAQVRRYIDGAEGTYGVAVLNFKDSRTTMVNAGEPFPMASMYKLFVMYRVLERVESGQIKMTDHITITKEDRVFLEDKDDLEVGEQLTVADALHAMVTRSDNSAAWALVRKVGGWNRIHSAAVEAGMDVTYADEQFLVSPADLTRFYYKLVGGLLLSRQSSEVMLSLLLQQKINDRLPKLLPPSTPVAHKTGELEDIRNDSGVVFGPKAAYIIVVMSYGGTAAGATRAEQAISRMVYDRYGE